MSVAGGGILRGYSAEMPAEYETNGGRKLEKHKQRNVG